MLDDFTDDSKRTLAARVGYHCSNPDSDLVLNWQTTEGPGCALGFAHQGFGPRCAV